MLNTTNQTTEDIEAWLQGLKEESGFAKDSSEEDSSSFSKEPSSTTFKQLEHEHLKKYLAKAKTKIAPSLFVLNGWDTSRLEHRHDTIRENLAYYLLPEHYQKMSGGFYVRIEDRGFAINPGPFFLENLHEKGLTIHAIDYVIVTNDCADNFSEIKAIYDLNIKCNQLQEDLHIISYYLHPGAYKALSSHLMPHFKQEKDSVRALEFYVDSNGMESIELVNDITLNYFQLDHEGDARRPLGISLEPKNSHLSQHIGWMYTLDQKTPLTLPSRLNPLDVLILTFSDSQAVSQQTNLLQELLTYPAHDRQRAPLVLCSLEGKKEGDNRLDSVKTLRQMVQKEYQDQLTILPCDMGLIVDLNEGKIQCSISGELTALEDIQVVKSKKSFGRLHYLSKNCVL